MGDPEIGARKCEVRAMSGHAPGMPCFASDPDAAVISAEWQAHCFSQSCEPIKQHSLSASDSRTSDHL